MRGKGLFCLSLVGSRDCGEVVGSVLACGLVVWLSKLAQSARVFHVKWKGSGSGRWVRRSKKKL